VAGFEAPNDTVDSFREKLLRPGKSYTAPLSEMPDLCGLRLIVYHPDDVRDAEKVVQNEFRINEEQSGSAIERLAANEFGYLSLHLIVSLADDRVSLTEWKPFQGMVAEIQVRTVLQHAWAAISHALQYKRESEVPNSLRRRLFRLSGLLELADEEFASLNAAHKHLVKELSDASPTAFAGNPIDRLSIKEYLERSDLPARIAKIAYGAGFSDASEMDGPPDELELKPSDEASQLVAMCTAANLKTVQELDDTLTRLLSRSKEIFKRLIADNEGKNWFGNPTFFIKLLVIFAFPESFSTDQLESDLDWDYEIAELVIHAAQSSVKAASTRSARKKIPK
jgi:putative GTP pyrophosphokinase